MCLSLSRLTVLLAIVAACMVGPVSAASNGGTANQRPRILVTNDDGIGSPGLRQLVLALSKDADVVICAPDSNRSGSSQAVPSLARPMTVKETDVPGAKQAFAVSGSPADSVCYAVVALSKDKAFDLVVSGINSSANVGDLSHSSGTIGAAMEGVYRGVPSIAVSQGGRTRDYKYSAGFAAGFAKKLLAKKPKPGVVYSINVPASRSGDIKGVAVRPMGGTMISVTGYRTRSTEEGVRTVQSRLKFERTGPEGSDSAAYFDGYITITPLKFDWTAIDVLKELKSWDQKK